MEAIARFVIATAASPWLYPFVFLLTVGDAFLVGRRLRVSWAKRTRLKKVQRVLGWAAHSLERRPASVLLTARFIPFGRIAVNLTAGATGCDYRRFAGLTAIAGVGWASYNVRVGAVFGRLLGDNPLLAVAASVVVAVGVGMIIDLVIPRRARPG